MSLSLEQFDLLAKILKNKKGYQKDLISNLVRLKLTDYVSNFKLNEKGMKSLDEYKVKRAVLLASGKGTRLLPLTLTKPKPLVEVNGTPIVVTLIEGLLKAGIDEIIIVRGYYGEAFNELLGFYPNLKLIDNPYYEEANNISSLFVARDFLQDCYIIEADLYLNNPEIILPFQFNSNYLGIPCEVTEDWYIKVDKAGDINEFGLKGEKCFQLVGISFWNKRDGNKLKKLVEEVFLKDNKSQLFWDQIALELFKEEFSIKVRECSEQDVFEIDSCTDLERLERLLKNQKKDIIISLTL